MRKKIIIGVGLLIIFALIGLAIYLSNIGYTWADWTGFSNYSGSVTKDDRGKTLWDWLQLLIVPAVLAVAALWFNTSERKNEVKMAEERTISEREIASDRNREELLQSYIDRMTELLLDKGLRTS